MPSAFKFTFEALYYEYASILKDGYQVITCQQFAAKTVNLTNKCLVNRVDVDFSLDKAKKLATVFNRLGIKASFFIRLHAKEYNPFSFEGYRILKFIQNSGHEIGYHSEIIDQSAIWNESAEDCLRRDIAVLETMVESKIQGVASHGGMTGLNNLDFWKHHRPAEFGLLYEAYDKEPAFNLFDQSRYVSDSNWTYWKSYDRGKLLDNDRRTPFEHAKEGVPLIYLLVHPDTYFNDHFYE